MYTNIPQIFQNTCEAETGLPEFHLMQLLSKKTFSRSLNLVLSGIGCIRNFQMIHIGK